ncbi:MAG: hypothetical protein NTX25_07720, partial [Proteobacteria bacterium]|nr:hypothetical protein [Pseudomonadota bacterium]
MEKRWNVYHGNDYLGLKTAREIRESLRQGSLDPFDKVSLENSNIREDLIDVDEIFKESNTQTSGTPHEAPADKRAPEETMYAPRNIAQAAAKKNINPPTAQAYARPSQAAVEEGARGDNSGRGNSTKRYYLISKEKVIGPLNALEIQSLFNRNMLNKNVRVQKIGNEKTIPITQFIASYSGDRLKELAEDGHIPQQIGVGSPSSKVMTELAR